MSAFRQGSRQIEDQLQSQSGISDQVTIVASSESSLIRTFDDVDDANVNSVFSVARSEAETDRASGMSQLRTTASACGCGACASCTGKRPGRTDVQIDQMISVSGNELPTVHFMVGNDNQFPPTVEVFQTNIQLNNSVSMESTFAVSDIDPNSHVLRYRFRDSSTAPQTGYHTLNGVVQQQGLVFEIDASQLSSVLYHAGALIGSELVSVEAYDGLFWSTPASASFATVVENLNNPIATGTNFFVESFETINAGQFMNATDPDGYPILEYSVYDSGMDGGYLKLNGVGLTPQTWVSISADDIDNLKYQAGTVGGVEEIRFAARDEGAWSNVASLLATTGANDFDPEVIAKDVTVRLNEQIPATVMFSYSDGDENSAKYYGFNDRGAASQSGHFLVNGVQQAAGTMFWVPASELNTVTYMAGTVFSVEEFQVQAFDGSRYSSLATADVFTADLPIVESGSLIMIDSLEQRRLKDLFSLSSAINPIQYEVIDMGLDLTSAKLVVNGIELEAGIIHTVSASDFEFAFVKGGTDDFGRSLDEFVVRADTGFAKSAWTGVNFSTDPVNERALLEIGRWQYDTPALELTFNFPVVVPEYYCTNGMDECTDFQQTTDPGMRAAFRQVTASFEEYFNIKFTEVGSSTPADITFSGSDSNPDAGGYAYAPRGSIPGTFDVGGDIFWTISQLAPAMQVAPGEYGWQLQFHELGHALGLNHSFEGTPPLPLAMENDRFSMMSYTQAFSDPNTNQIIYSASPMLYDVMALQSLYGANPTFRAGNTQIKFEPVDTVPQTVYDSGGKDTFNLNNHSLNSKIDLRPGQFSSVGGLTDNVGIVWGTDIENARGGSGNDVIIGNETNNFLLGNDGNDRITGNGGPDFLRGMKGNDTYVYRIGDGHDTVQELFGAGRDTIEVQLFDEYFDDMEDDLGGNALQDNFQFRAAGLDLEINLTLDGGSADNGQIRVQQMGYGKNRVETLRLVNAEGVQVGPEISLLSIYSSSDGNFAAFQTTSGTSRYGNLAIQV